MIENPPIQDYKNSEAGSQAHKGAKNTTQHVPQGSGISSEGQYQGEQDPEHSSVETIEELRAEVKRLRNQQAPAKSSEWLVIHKIKGNKTAYLAEPSWVLSDSHSKRYLPQLRGNSAITNEHGYLNMRPQLAFVVYKYYSVKHQLQEIRKAVDESEELPSPEAADESIQLLSHEAADALDLFMNSHEAFDKDFAGWDSKARIKSPYLFWYRYRSHNNIENMPKAAESQLRLLTDWIDSHYRELYDAADAELGEGLVSKFSIQFLVQPGDALIIKEGNCHHGFVSDSWGCVVPKKGLPTTSRNINSQLHREMDSETDSEDEPQDEETDDSQLLGYLSTNAWHYQFDGRFHRQKCRVYTPLPAATHHKPVMITTLDIYPLKYASEALKIQLERRGRRAWKCRKRAFIEYSTAPEDGSRDGHERYMVDIETYRKLHPDSNSQKGAVESQFVEPYYHERQDVSAEFMVSDDPPPEPDIFAFPNSMTAYNLQRKKWETIQVDCIRDVSWNKKAFDHLVVDPQAKELIQALVTNKINKEQSTDLVEGKGNGLIILLHGGPGTGKTFTAESVAEIAEKPLYRVTCGDIGTKPDEVEKYLESVLHLGKIWDCVVLLDEADVFLEQRTLTDLERNALVSVFLRVLEYYEGILILTSNRVGTFDEAFKSRIQLSLHYEPLTQGQRHKIWKNFLHRLQSLDEEQQQAAKIEPLGDNRKRKLDLPLGIDFDDIECYLSELAEKPMNGRQIRNAITTARQLAKFKGVDMSSVHLKHVIGVSKKFDEYLDKVQDGYSDEQIARDGRIR
ncbi:hypothetical protein QBC43DRAFT_327956 [Cladorrhinum sp. PSN259]|nr:hypothetical protein QBC43DRAFT_327956 [Cladorrhinum sp. PSN259]